MLLWFFSEEAVHLPRYGSKFNAFGRLLEDLMRLSHVDLLTIELDSIVSIGPFDDVFVEVRYWFRRHDYAI